MNRRDRRPPLRGRRSRSRLLRLTRHETTSSVCHKQPQRGWGKLVEATTVRQLRFGCRRGAPAGYRLVSTRRSTALGAAFLATVVMLGTAPTRAAAQPSPDPVPSQATPPPATAARTPTPQPDPAPSTRPHRLLRPRCSPRLRLRWRHAEPTGDGNDQARPGTEGAEAPGRSRPPAAAHCADQDRRQPAQPSTHRAAPRGRGCARSPGE